MVKFVVVFIALATAAEGLKFTDKQYYSLPRLFHLDDYEECMASRRGAYCVGTFELMPSKNEQLLSILQVYSEDKYNFDHTKIHRGYCLPTTCSDIDGSSMSSRFHRCVNKVTLAQYGLEANLTELQHCRRATTRREIDGWDVAFARIAGVLLVLNMIGTAYDYLRNPEQKPIQTVLAWSLIANWQRLVADHSDKDPRLTALRPVQGMKTLTLILVMLAHSVLAHHLVYTTNPQYLEKASLEFPTIYFQNGSSIVHTFIMISNFLLSYNLLVAAGDNPKKKYGIGLLPKCFMHRITRISPVYLFIIGLNTTWWAHAGDGPLWAPLIEAESARCRDKWWAHALFINNFVKIHDRCLIHTWFLAVDMQLYLVSAALTLLLLSKPRTAVKVLGGLLCATLLVNFTVIYVFELLPMVQLKTPENMRIQFVGNKSFAWLYSMPWDSLPSALVGLLVAFLHYNQQVSKVQSVDSTVVCLLTIFGYLSNM